MYILSYWFVYCACIAVWNRELVSFFNCSPKRYCKFVHLGDFCSYVLTKLADPGKNKKRQIRGVFGNSFRFILYNSWTFFSTGRVQKTTRHFRLGFHKSSRKPLADNLCLEATVSFETPYHCLWISSCERSMLHTAWDHLLLVNR